MSVQESNESPLDSLQKKLYAGGALQGPQESTFSSMRTTAPEHWKAPPPQAPQKPKMSGAVIFLGVAAAFFIIAGGITAFVLFMGGRSVSSDHVDISIEGPTTVAGGEGVPLLITIKNANPVAVTNASITLQYPDGTTEADDTATSLAHYTESLGDIAAGGSVRTTARAAFFGTENQKVTIPITVEYRTGNSNAVFVKKTQYEFVISTSPVGVTVTTLSEVASGQSLTLSVLVRSNASASLENVAVRAEYPFGFSAKSSSPEPVSGLLFSLGTLAPGEEREIRVTGTLLGQDGENRVFRFTAGALRSALSKEFGISYTAHEMSVTIAKPFFTVALGLNRDDAPTVVVREGEPIVGLLTWTNALATPILDGAILVALSGDALDASNVEVTNGFYRSLDKTIRFDRETVASLAQVKPGDTGNGSFTLVSKTGNAGSALRNPSMTLAISVSGRRVGENNVPETVSSTLIRTIKIQSTLSLAMRAVRSLGDFENTGPWPPEADKETTYTVMLSAHNTVNSVANTVAKMTLPSYVRFTGLMNPTGAIAFNEATREVTWTLGDIAAGASKEASFQVALLPSVSQKGTSPTLVSEATISGVDRFVQKQVSATASRVTSDPTGDPAYQTNSGIVKP